MAEDRDQRTEAPTAKRIEEAEDRGQVAFSAELTQSALLLAGLGLLVVCGASILGALMQSLREGLSGAPRADLSVASAAATVGRHLQRVFVPCLPFFAGLVVAGASVAYLQVGIRIRTKAIEWSLARLDPIAGLKRLWSLRALLRLAMQVAKLAFIVAIVYAGSPDYLARAAHLGGASLRESSATAAALAAELAARIGVATLLLAGADVAYQRWQHLADLRMTKDEMKDELRQTQGDPAVKARIRRAQRAAAHRRMLRDVPKATVVLTNPTHFAVAVRYRRPGGLDPADEAPVVVAKGADLLAKRIREIAVEAGVPIVENPPLARSLHRLCEVGMTIPPDLYRAVAEVLAFVYRLRGAVARS